MGESCREGDVLSSVGGVWSWELGDRRWEAVEEERSGGFPAAVCRGGGTPPVRGVGHKKPPPDGGGWRIPGGSGDHRP